MCKVSAKSEMVTSGAGKKDKNKTKQNKGCYRRLLGNPALSGTKFSSNKINSLNLNY